MHEAKSDTEAPAADNGRLQPEWVSAAGQSQADHHAGAQGQLARDGESGTALRDVVCASVDNGLLSGWVRCYELDPNVDAAAGK